MGAVAKALGDAYAEPAKDVEGYIEGAEEVGGAGRRETGLKCSIQPVSGSASTLAPKCRPADQARSGREPTLSSPQVLSRDPGSNSN
jgi:hypothetical protein